MIRVILLSLAFLTLSSQQYKLTKVKINKDISIKLPSDFTPVPPDEIAAKYMSYRSPIALYSNLTKSTDFSINYSVSKWQSNDLALVQSFYKSNISNLFDSVEFLEEDIVNINERDFIVFEFNSTISEAQSSLRENSYVKKYYYIQYALKDGHVFIFSLSSPAGEASTWRPVFKEIMQSVKLK